MKSTQKQPTMSIGIFGNDNKKDKSRNTINNNVLMTAVGLKALPRQHIGLSSITVGPGMKQK